jgi:hypothetical protein
MNPLAAGFIGFGLGCLFMGAVVRMMLFWRIRAATKPKTLP